MHKAIQLQVTLWIEGEEQPGDNFNASTTQAIEDIISYGKAQQSGFKVTIKNIFEDTEYDGNEKSAS